VHWIATYPLALDASRGDTPKTPASATSASSTAVSGDRSCRLALLFAMATAIRFAMAVARM
jgi:hypothetical protein